MNLKKIWYVLIVVSIQESKTENTGIVPIATITIPKAGTHLLNGCIKRLTKKTPSFSRLVADKITDTSCNVSIAGPLIKPSFDVFDKATTNLYQHEFFTAHLAYDPFYERMLAQKKFKVLFLVRDPRDQIVSRAFYIKKHRHLYPGLQHLSLEEIMLAFIGSKDEPQVFTNLLSSHLCFLDKPTQKSVSNIVQFYQSYLSWSQVSNCYTVRFENLVGPKGGGNLKKQITEIRNIAHHIGIQLSDKIMSDIQQNLFGNSHTFREGKIGSWKKYFKEEHKKLFKEIAGNLLIKLGYEKDLNW